MSVETPSWLANLGKKVDSICERLDWLLVQNLSPILIRLGIVHCSRAVGCVLVRYGPHDPAWIRLNHLVVGLRDHLVKGLLDLGVGVRVAHEKRLDVFPVDSFVEVANRAVTHAPEDPLNARRHVVNEAAWQSP